jgi:hypothetical protein
MAALPQEIFVKIRSATKIRILFLYWDSPAKENRLSEKLNYQVRLVHSASTINFRPLPTCALQRGRSQRDSQNCRAVCR